MKLSVHDLIPYHYDESTEAAYQRTVSFIQAIEGLNYERYWFAEQHGSRLHASIAPELLVAYMAARTQKIRLGTGGTMISHYSPLKLAENFKTLSALAPGRIDLGFGRAPGSNSKERLALANGNLTVYDDQYAKIEATLAYLQNQEPAGIYAETQAMPRSTATYPQAWMLGSTGQSVQKAAEWGMGYCFSKFFNFTTDLAIFDRYRQNFRPSPTFSRPYIMISYAIVVAETEEEANFLAKPFELERLGRMTGKEFWTFSAEDVVNYQYSASEARYVQRMADSRFIIKGTPDQVYQALQEEEAEIGMDEILIYCPILDTDRRLYAYEQLAKRYHLTNSSKR